MVCLEFNYLNGNAEMPAQAPSTDASLPDQIRKIDRKGEPAGMKGGVKTLFRDPPEAMLIGPVQFPVKPKKFPVNSRREITRNALICHLDSGRLGSA